MSSNITLGDVLSELSEQGYELPPIDENQISDLRQEEEAGSPWYLRLFVGISAWIAALLFIAFLFLSNILLSGGNDLIIGLLFCALGILLSRVNIQRDFTRQVGLALSLAGQVLFLFGLMDMLYTRGIHYSEHAVWITLILTALELILIALNKDPVQRFLSVLIIVGTMTFLFIDQDLPLVFHLLVFLLAASAVFLFSNEYSRFALSHEDLWQPVAYGTTVALLGLLLLPLAAYLEIEYLWVTAVLLLAVLLYLEWQILAEMGLAAGRDPWFWILLACTLILVIPATRMPGILGALIVLLLGFWRSKRTLLGIAVLFLIFYLGAFYYYLDWTLLVKSLALVGTGILLFITRFLFRYFTKEVPS